MHFYFNCMFPLLWVHVTALIAFKSRFEKVHFLCSFYIPNKNRMKTLGIVKSETKERELLQSFSSWDNLPGGEVETLFHESFNTK